MAEGARPPAPFPEAIRRRGNAERSCMTETAVDPKLGTGLGRPQVPMVRVEVRRPARVSRRGRLRRLDAESLVVAGVPFLVELMLGWRLAAAGALPGDAIARVQNASSVIWSRDPHFESIGFVWSPFPTVFEIPILALRKIFPFLATHGYAGVLVSAAFLAGCVWVVNAWCKDLGLTRGVRLVLVAVFWLHPLILLLGADGMSETVMLFFLLVAARDLSRWWEDRHLSHLIVAAMAMAMAYLTRYEVIGAVLAFGAAAGIEAWRSATGGRHAALRRAALVAVVALLPPLTAVGMWAVYSWLIVGEFFAQLSSAYGNSYQVKAASEGIIQAAGAVDGLPRAELFVRQLVFMAPAALLMPIAAVWLSVRHMRRVVSALVVLGAPLAFQLLGAFTGTTFHWVRFVIAVIPLTVLLTAAVIADVESHGFIRPVIRDTVVALLVISTAASLVTASVTLRRGGDIGAGDEVEQLALVPGPYRLPDPDVVQPTIAAQRVARDLEAMGVGPGDVLTDSASTFAIVLAARDQRIFRIPADRDYLPALSDPYDFGVRYILLPDPDGHATDSILRADPSMFDQGAPWLSLTEEWGSDRDPANHVRLYEVEGSPD